MRARACLVLMFGAVKVFALTSANLYEREEIQLKINFVVELEKKAVKADLIRQGRTREARSSKKFQDTS